MNRADFFRSYDFVLVLLVLGLSVFGIPMIRAAAGTGLTPRFETLYASQRIFVITGAALMVGVSLVDYRLIAKFHWAVYGFCLALLITVLLIGADPVTGTARWLRLPMPVGGDFTLQPSELAKIGVIIFLSKFIFDAKEKFNRIWMLAVILILVAVPVALIYRQPSLSACLVVAFTAFVMLFAAGLKMRTIIVGSAITVPAAAVVVYDMHRQNPIFLDRLMPYQWVRIQALINPVPGSNELYQVERSLAALGSGGLFGKGYGNISYVPNGFNDFIFAVIGEQYGFVGCAVVLIVVALIIFKCILIARRAPDLTGRIIAAGVAGMIMFETFVNVGVVTALLPNTGMPLPFLSYGGTSMWVHMLAVGIVLNVGIVRPKSIFDDSE
ncbi:MAG: rod shape-determining protein RodA [Defluviitaleaceae bacterium]|nr:rod shape-determining protein RodA [Defluviitaleaceae bacterium]